MIRYYITDRRRVPDLRAHIAKIVEAGTADWIQIREKDLPAKELYALTSDVVQLARPAGIRVLVNERSDIAIAAGADGVHLPSHAVSAAVLPRRMPLIGVSCHNQAELARAQREGASFAVLGPVFAPRSKSSDLPPLGLPEFQHLVRSATIPVLALGGITHANIAECMAAGASGVAGISLFDPVPSRG